VTPTLETALSGLPAKPRVHELSKRIGISNKELLAALAARGLSITSASASVPQAVAQAVIQEMLGGAADEETQPVDITAAEIPAAAEIPTDGGDAFNPLFLPPADAPPEPSASDESDGGEEAAPARTGGSRRRRGRSGGRKPAKDAPAESPAAEETAQQDDADAAALAEPDDAQTVIVADGDEDQAAEQLGGDEGARGEDTDADTDDDSSARGRRRRRGRRGRGRVTDTDERGDGRLDEPESETATGGSVGDQQTGADELPASEPVVTEPADESDSDES